MSCKSVSYTIKRKGVWKIRPFKKNEVRFVNVKKFKNNIEKEYIEKIRLENDIANTPVVSSKLIDDYLKNKNL